MRTGLALAVLIAVAGQRAEGLAWPAGGNGPSARDRLVVMADESLAAARQLSGRGARAEAHVLARRALDLYEDALGLGPPDAELHYRAYVAAQLYQTASPSPEDFHAVIRHVDGLRAADPLDPRLTDMLAALCHALARLAAVGGPEADALLERGIHEYEKMFQLLGLRGPEGAADLAVSYANVAELLMAVERLEDALEYYRLSTTLPTRDLPALRYYGLAVAHDRLGQAEQARQAMLRALELDPELGELHDERVYFVPDGDIHYYEALAHETAGRTSAAIRAYREFLAVAQTVRPAYRNRAREHLDAMTGHATRAR